jgi:hypothetical protein
VTELPATHKLLAGLAIIALAGLLAFDGKITADA